MGCAQGSSRSIIHVRRSGKHFSFKSGIENSRACSLKIELGDATAQAVSTGTHPVVEHAGHNLVPVEDGEVDQGGLPRTPLLNVLHIHGRRPAHFSSGAPAFGQPHMCMKRLGNVLPLQALLSVHKTHQYPLLPYTQCYIHPIPYMYPTYISTLYYYYPQLRTKLGQGLGCTAGCVGSVGALHKCVGAAAAVDGKQHEQVHMLCMAPDAAVDSQQHDLGVLQQVAEGGQVVLLRVVPERQVNGWHLRQPMNAIL